MPLLTGGQKGKDLTGKDFRKTNKQNDHPGTICVEKV